MQFLPTRQFTPSIIRKHFPVTCSSCPLGNLNRRSSNVATDASTPREILPGEEMEIDIHGEVSDSTGRPSPSFSGALYWILAVCRTTGLLWGKTVKSRKDLFRHLDKFHGRITSRSKALKVIRSDNEFLTAVVTDWLHDKRGISILPSIPYEHDTVCTVECANQTMDSTITKMLDLSRNKQLSRQHWAMAFTHALKIKNRLPSFDFMAVYCRQTEEDSRARRIEGGTNFPCTMRLAAAAPP